MAKITIRRSTTSPLSPANVAAFILILAILLALALTPGRARADATPVQVALSYLDGVSTWGPKTASGVAEIIRGEGEARVSVRGLAPEPGIHYVLWLGRDGTSDAFQVGEVTVQPDGTATLDLVVANEIPNRGWNMALITAEASLGVDRPGPKRILAGRYPRPLPQGTLPVGLPNTGEGGGAAVPPTIPGWRTT